MTRDLRTASLHDMLVRFRDGDEAALDELIRRTAERLERLAGKMLLGFPAVGAREQAEDVLQNALIRLTRSLREVHPPTTADFFRLAAEQIRRELLDLARYHRRRSTVNQPFPTAMPEPAETSIPEANDLDRWQSLHEAVERLPADERQVFALTFYHGRTQVEIGELIGVSDRQARRLWREACLRLNEILGGNLPTA
jgi:RNA polymerase sigma-70 factor (ECF subfamily)